MKSLLSLFLLVSAPAFADSTLILPHSHILSFSHRGGFVAPPFQNRGCEIYGAEVDLLANGRITQRHPLRFSMEIPNAFRLESLLNSARNGALFSTRGTVPDAGVSEYRDVYRGNIVLLRNAFPQGLRNNSPAAAALVRFTDLNCR